MYLGDNLLRDGITDLVAAFREHEPDALIMLTPVLEPDHYGVAELDGDRVVRLVEKPKDPPSNLALVGVYMFTPSVFDAARAIEPSPRGELEITDTIQYLIDQGAKVEQHLVKGWWKDTGQLADMLAANRLVLEEIEPRTDGELIDSTVEGRVVIERGRDRRADDDPRPRRDRRRRPRQRRLHRPLHRDRRRLRGDRLRGRALDPARAAPGSDDLASRMEASLLGRDVNRSRSDGLPKTIRMIVGDSSELTLP